MPDITYARVVDGVVHGAPLTLPDTVKLGKDLFDASEAALYHACDATVGDGWLYDGKAFSAPPPPPVPPRFALGYSILGVLTDAERSAALTSAVKTWDRLMIQSRPDPFPEGNPKIARFATALGTTPKSLFDRVYGVTAPAAAASGASGSTGATASSSTSGSASTTSASS